MYPRSLLRKLNMESPRKTTKNAIQTKGKTLREGIDAWHQKAEGKASIDYGFHMITTDVNPTTLREMKDFIAEGITSFKMFMA